MLFSFDAQIDDDDFEAAVRTAQAEYDQHQPDVVIGSSRGGAVALNRLLPVHGVIAE